MIIRAQLRLPISQSQLLSRLPPCRLKSSTKHPKKTHSPTSVPSNPIPLPVPPLVESRVPDQNANIFRDVVANLQPALTSRHVKGVIQCWESLKAHDLHRHLSATQLARMATLLTEDFLPKDPKLEFWLSSDRKLIEDVAIAAALSKSFHALDVYLRFLFTKPRLFSFQNSKDTGHQHVIQAYTTYTKLQQQKLHAREEPSEFDIMDLGFYEDNFLPARGPDAIPQINILLSAIRAYAKCDDFGGAYRAVLNGVRFHDQVNKDYLATIPTQEERDRFERWLARLEIARLVSAPGTFSRYLRNTGVDLSAGRLIRLYSGVIDGISGKDPFIAPDVSMVDEKRIVPMTDRVWVAFLSSFLVAGATDKAEQLWQDMTRFGLIHVAPLWTALMDSFASRRQTDSVVQTFEKMKVEGIQPDAMTYRALLAALLDSRYIDAALDHFADFQSNIQQHSELSMKLTVYNTYIGGLLQRGSVDLALGVFDDMQHNTNGSPSPDLITFNTLMGYYGRHGELKQVGSLLQNMAERGVVADAVTYSIMLSALWRAGQENALQTVFTLMEKQGLRPTSVTYSTMMVQLLRERDMKSLQAALRILDNMETKKSPKETPSITSYEAFLTELWRTPWLNVSQGAVINQDILARMKKRRTSLNINVYGVLIRAALLPEYPQGAVVAWDLYQKMYRQNLSVPHQLVLVLLDGMIKLGQLDLCLKLCADIERMGLKHTGYLSSLFRKVEILKRDANSPSYYR